jgi:hypothetical protein
MVLFSQKCPAVEPGGRAQTVYCCTVAAIQWPVAVNFKNTIRALFSVIYTSTHGPCLPSRRDHTLHQTTSKEKFFSLLPPGPLDLSRRQTLHKP